MLIEKNAMGVLTYLNHLLCSVHLFMRTLAFILFMTPNPVPVIPVTSLLVLLGEMRVHPRNYANHPAQDVFRNGEQIGLIVEALICINSTCLRDHDGLNNTHCWLVFLITYGPISEICGDRVFLTFTIGGDVIVVGLVISGKSAT